MAEHLVSPRNLKMKRTFLILMIGLSLFSASQICSAQKQADMERLSSQLDGELTKLDAASQNILDMLRGLSEAQYLPASTAYAAIEDASNRYYLVSNNAAIATVMLDQRDYQRVLKFLKISCNSAKKTSDRAAKAVNSTLVRLTSSALIAEFTRARDLIQSLSSTPLCD